MRRAFDERHIDALVRDRGYDVFRVRAEDRGFDARIREQEFSEKRRQDVLGDGC
jgi:hypothetical protein